jgi:thiol:disulfide interchange protein
MRLANEQGAKVRTIATWLAAALLLLVSNFASTEVQAKEAAGNHIAVRLVAESQSPAPGSEVALAFLMTPQPGWHGYWRNPGDAGVEMQADWKLPAGASAGSLTYPVPHTLVISGLMNYVYEGPYAVLASVRIPAEAAKGAKLPIAVHLDYLACTDRICVPEQADVAIDLTVGEGAPDRRSEFDRYRLATPKPLGTPAAFENAGGNVRIAIPLPASVAVGDAYFFPGTRDALAYSEPQAFSRRGDMLIVETKAGADAASLKAIEGVLKIGEDQGFEVHAAPGVVGAAGDPLSAGAAKPAGYDWLTIAAALLGAILGGLVLNVMPCVFPILSLKALSLAKAGGDEAPVRREAYAYTAGVILTCLALGGALLALRAAGTSVGWAFQLQDPRSILLLLLLVGGITLNLAGLFELPAVTGGSGLAEKGGTHGAFWTGALAAFVATPCTGPFMGAALGAALVLPTAAALAIFAGLGFGLALPFLLLGLLPSLRRRLPKPGPWMIRLRHILAVPMALTAAALLWVLNNQAGQQGLLLGIAALVALALCLWLVGRRQGVSRAWLPLLPALAAAAGAIVLMPVPDASAQSRSASALDAEPFSEARLAALRAEGRPVFLYFTADWCVTCKVNEKAVLERDAVGNAFREAKVAVLVGDWTNGDPSITRFLEGQGRSGVPLYLYYAPGSPQPKMLPQLLTVGEVTALAS